MASTFKVAGSTITLNALEALPRRFSERFGGIPSLVIERRGVDMEATDPWVGKTIEWSMSGTVYLTGDIVSMTPRHDEHYGWIKTYQCLGLRNRLDWFPHTDSLTGINSSAYNLPAEAGDADPLYSAARAGRTVGQMLTDVLTMVANAQALDAHGIGGYTGLPSAPALPSDTVTDLAALTVIPPHGVYFTGEKFGAALDSFMSANAPNHRVWIDPSTGHFRFVDLRTMAATTFTIGIDDIDVTEISRDVGDCFQRVVVLGAPVAVMVCLQLSKGDLTEQFAHDGLSTAAAKAAWTPADYRQPGAAQDVGTCTCPSTLTVTVDPTSGSTAWSSGFWDQSHQQGVIDLRSTSISNYTQYWSARIVACPALTAGGTATLTVDYPLPHTSFDSYSIHGLATGGSVVWTQYQIANTDLWPRVTSQSTYPRPFAVAGGSTLTMLSSSLGVVLWSSGGSPPYNTFPLAFTYTASTGMIRFIAPTYVIANNAPPADVVVYLPIMQNPNAAVYPADIAGVPQYAGTSHTVDGLTKTLTVTIEDWRDPGQLAGVLDYAADLLDSVKDAVCEGTITYKGLYLPALTLGMSANVACDEGGSIPTGWESLNLGCIGVDLEWTNDAGTQIETTLHLSNRRAHYSAEMFLAPARSFTPIGMGADGEVWNPYGISQDVPKSPYAADVGPEGNAEAFSDFVRGGGLAGMAGRSLGAGNFDAFAPPGMTGGAFGDGGALPMSPADLGLMTSPEQMGLPMTPGDLGLPTGEMFGGGGAGGGNGVQAAGAAARAEHPEAAAMGAELALRGEALPPEPEPAVEEPE